MRKNFLIIAVILFASCQKGNDTTEDDSLIFRFHRNGGFTGLKESLIIDANLTSYSVRYNIIDKDMVIEYKTTVITNEDQWNYLKNSFDSKSFSEIEDGPCRACVDGIDETLFVTKNGKTDSIYNAITNENYRKMQGFFDVIMTQSNIFKMHFSEGFGCSSFLVYKLNDYKDVGIAVIGDMEKLNLSETEQSFNLSENEDLFVEINKFSDNAHGYYCDCVFEGEISETWKSVSGTAKIKIKQNIIPHYSEFESHTINITLENVVLQNNDGSTIIIYNMVFSDVGVGWLPG